MKVKKKRNQDQIGILLLVISIIFISTNAFAPLRTNSESRLLVTDTPTPTATPLNSFVCNNAIPGAACQNFGTYMRYDIDLTKDNNRVDTNWLPIEITASMVGQNVYISYDLTYMFTNPSRAYTGWARNTNFLTRYGTQPNPINSTAPSASGVYQFSGTVAQNFYGAPGTFRLYASGQWSEDTAIQGYIIFSNSPISATSTPTATFTPTATLTHTPTATLTPTPTATNTPPPNYDGSGTCWESAASWAGYTVSYTIDRNTIPTSMGWDSSIRAAAQTWNDVTPSHFEFVESTDSGNVISYGQTQLQDSIAEVSPNVYWLFYITQKLMVINSNIIVQGILYTIDTNNTPDPNNPDKNGSTTTANLQNALTHEFGHFLQLNHPDNSCSDTTMLKAVAPGEIKKITLDAADKEAINWQYP